ncbi:hypothetical protein C7C56_002550 [Massilia glaciei]|uniref:Uncharacterized protein n=2 Tax=Massilia glaciei TaxID=1524097 RepID=A0A2U2I6Q3_9BURK|nr:hypothetical protein C7C56_002550 [Massilia glaciei]
MMLPPPGADTPPPGPVLGSTLEADRALAEAARLRAAAEADYADSERFCYTKFFVNNCLDAARERRRATLAVVRVVEVDAGRYKRAKAVEERDLAMAEAAREHAANEARRAVEWADREPAAKPVAEAARPARAPDRARREAEHAAKLARIAERERAEAPLRAARAARFEEKRAESARRQRAVAAKQAAKRAEKQAEKAEKDASEGRFAPADPAPPAKRP